MNKINGRENVSVNVQVIRQRIVPSLIAETMVQEITLIIVSMPNVIQINILQPIVEQNNVIHLALIVLTV
jgi:hypothetical protein